MFILGIETSCDDTSLAILQKSSEGLKLVAHQSFSQENILREWGGIVPEIAARNHLDKLGPLLGRVLESNQLKIHDINLVAVTTSPGLLGPLLTGITTAKTIALMNQIPIVAVNHLYAHIEAIHLTEKVSYPYLGLVVSGGHTLLFKVSASDEFELLATTIDDAIGEAFDKGGKILGLPYPAGKFIDQLAQFGNHLAFSFPQVMKGKSGQLSYSGLKNALRVLAEKENLSPPPQTETAMPEYQRFYDLCASYQHALVEQIVEKIATFKKTYRFPLVVGGGVACNSYLRKKLKAAHPDTYFVRPEFCTDNGAMIANYAARNQNLAVKFPDCLLLTPKSRHLNKSELQ